MPAGRDLLRRRAATLGRLCGELTSTERLVLLGDVIELRDGRMADALAQATPVLAEIARALPGGAEIIVLPGNHDHHLLEPWYRSRAAAPSPEPLEVENPVAPDPGSPLAAVAAALGPDRVRIAYPGVWLRDDVFATHGHYLDRHTTVPILERLAAGVTARVTFQPDGAPRRVEDYEAVLAPVYAWIHAVAQAGGGRGGASAQGWAALTGGDGRGAGGRLVPLRRGALRAGFAAAVTGLNRAGIGPLRRDLSGPALRRASLAALGEVLERLGITAEHVVFGHSHRAGPLPRDRAHEWRGRRGQRLINCGCWVQEGPMFLGSDPQTSPYRAGFAVRVPEPVGEPPELVNLLDPPETADRA